MTTPHSFAGPHGARVDLEVDSGGIDPLQSPRSRSRRWPQPRPAPLAPAARRFFTELLGLTEELAGDYPTLWPQVAAALDAAGHEYTERARSAYQRAAEQAEVDDPLQWQRWSDFERRNGDDFQALVKSIRAVETDGAPVEYCSQVAFDLSEYISRYKQDVPVTRRSFLAGSVRATMEGHDRERRLDATALSRLGWLYLIEYSPTSNPDQNLVERSRFYAQRGLELDPENHHCLGLLNRTT